MKRPYYQVFKHASTRQTLWRHQALPPLKSLKKKTTGYGHHSLDLNWILNNVFEKLKPCLHRMSGSSIDWPGSWTPQFLSWTHGSTLGFYMLHWQGCSVMLSQGVVLPIDYEPPIWFRCKQIIQFRGVDTIGKPPSTPIPLTLSESPPLHVICQPHPARTTATGRHVTRFVVLNAALSLVANPQGLRQSVTTGTCEASEATWAQQAALSALSQLSR